MSLLGYDPNEHYTGRAPLEAAAQGIELGPNDWAIRCNLVTIIDQVMKDFTADHISTEDEEVLRHLRLVLEVFEVLDLEVLGLACRSRGWGADVARHADLAIPDGAEAGVLG